MTKLTVYTKPACIECQRTKAALRKRGLSYVEVNVEADESVAKELYDEGWRSLPVVKVTPALDPDIDSWAGFRADLIDRIPKGVDAA